VKLDRTTAWAVTLVGVAAMTISYVDRQALSVLSPTVTKALGIDDAAYGWLGAAFAGAYLVAGPFAGALVDALGARRSLPGAILLWSCVAALHALAPGFGTLLGLRVALGLAESPTFPAGAQVVQRVLPAADRARGMSTLFVGMSLGGMLAPPLAIGIAKALSWRWAFVGTALVAAVWLPAWMAMTRAGAVLEALDRRPGGGGGAAAVGPSTGRGRRIEAATHPAMLRGLVGLFAVAPASHFAFAWEAKLYVGQIHMRQEDLAPYLMLSAFLYDIGALAFGDLASRRARARGDADPHRLLFGTGAACAATGMLVLASAHTPAHAMVGMGFAAVGRGAVVTLVNSDTLARMPQRMVSAAGGVVASAQSLAGLLVNPIVGTVVKHHGFVPVLVALAAWTLPLATMWLLWRPPAPDTCETSET
jgi:ACS family hexuronate transporter-like MFS transporter